jgi:DUF4097 and DUF4098 domain-containing protein YvlB
MRTLVTYLLVAFAVPAIPASAQVYPERVRSVTRGPVVHVREARYQRPQDREEQTERSVKTVRIGSKGELDISNISGDIVITRGGGNEVTIEITKTSRGRSVQDARELLQLVEVSINERAGRAEVRTHYPRDDDRRNRRNVNVSVAFTVTAPAGTRVTVESISGNISVRDIRGEAALKTTSGNIAVANGGYVAKAASISGSVEITGAEIEGALNASSVSGNVIVRKIKGARLDLGSVSGNVVFEDIECDRVSGQSTSGNLSYTGRLVSGGRYELTSHSGEIHLEISGSTGFELDANSFSGSIRSDLPITVQGGDRDRGRRQRTLHGTYGDASAMLDLTTFSGSIVIAKR